jgi:hypothetical protein
MKMSDALRVLRYGPYNLEADSTQEGTMKVAPR